MRKLSAIALASAQQSLFAAAALVLMTNAANAAEDGNFYLQHCKNNLSESTMQGGFLEGVCFGIIEGLSYVRDSLPQEYRFCTPNGVTKQQKIRVVVLYLENNPSLLHRHFPHLALEAMRKAWPCR